MNKKKLLDKITNSAKNIRFADFVMLIEAYGFRRTRCDGSHEIYRRKGISDIVNIQNNKGQAKPYQVRQFLSLVEKHNLKLEENDV
ncbi:MAG: type II toxin-antitoxin system HicA family toxin [Defluviitaleaceae bacterium]|nr:type II toxin-antitoxin system HicA family toxin [Defluviitaleaceae bacterium]MCL2239342.1 type II toxin-antitoxin system HicA family toxin [Defluviitaleaceae bacterium]